MKKQKTNKPNISLSNVRNKEVKTNKPSNHINGLIDWVQRWREFNPNYTEEQISFIGSLLQDLEEEIRNEKPNDSTDKFVKFLESEGYEVIDCTPNNMDKGSGDLPNTKNKAKCFSEKRDSVITPTTDVHLNSTDWSTRFDKKFPAFDGIGALFPIFKDNPNRNHIIDFISSELQREREQKIKVVYNQVCEQIAQEERNRVLEEVEGIIGEDEKYTIISHKYGTETGEIEKTIGDGEKEWKDPRNEFRHELLSKIKELKQNKVESGCMCDDCQKVNHLPSNKTLEL